MKTFLAVLTALGVTAASVQAQFTYYDGVDFNNHPDAPGGENMFLSGGAPFVTDTGDGTANWRYRNTGPANVSFGTNSYQGRLTEGDPAFYQTITGLNPNSDYTVRVYGVWSGGNNNWGFEYSLNDGASWSAAIRRDTINNAINWGAGSWVDTSDNGVGVALDPNVPGGDTRGYVIAGLMTTDGSGTLDVWVRGISTERSVWDGLAVAPGVVPEPSSFALAGFGIAALLVFRRRRR